MKFYGFSYLHKVTPQICLIESRPQLLRDSASSTWMHTSPFQRVPEQREWNVDSLPFHLIQERKVFLLYT